MRNFIGCIKLNSEEDKWSWHLCQFYFPSSQHGAQHVWLTGMTDNFFKYLFFLHHNVKVAETFNWLTASCSWSCGVMKSVTRRSFTRFVQVLGSWASQQLRKTISSMVLFPFKLHLLLSQPNIFIMGEIKPILVLWHLGVINDAPNLISMWYRLRFHFIRSSVCNIESQGQATLLTTS